MDICSLFLLRRTTRDIGVPSNSEVCRSLVDGVGNKGGSQWRPHYSIYSLRADGLRPAVSI